MPTAHWRDQSHNWARFARSGTDSYWQYREAFFEHFVPSVPGLAVDIGCGEGRTTRDLSGRAGETIGIDASFTLISYARAADPHGRYVAADAGALPLQMRLSISLSLTTP